ncbi:MAG: histidinol-phosphate transaminase [Rhodospirillaceae bacterium]|nr:histidinol-phosphate transaminase [Rhodospirillaceae bacterium]
MSSPLITPRPGILNIKPYVGGDSKIQGKDQDGDKTSVIKLASNEGAFGPSPKALEAIAKTAQSVNRYPDGNASALHAAIGKRFGLDPARIICGAGSDEILSLLAYSYSGPGDEVLYTEHGFLMYPIAAKAAGATPVAAPETDLRTDVDKLLGAVTNKTKIVFLANPNNPTGTYISSSELQRLRAGLPADVLLVIDAAYAEFVSRDDYTPGFELVDQGQNTVMTRTFSKIFALGGLRLGWAYMPAEIADVINRVRGPFNVSSIAQAAGIAALEDIEFFNRSREHAILWVEKTQTAFRQMGLQTTNSVGNFVLVRFDGNNGKTAEAADAYLRDNSIIVRKMDAYGLPEYLRVSIGNEEEMNACIKAIEKFLKS